MARSYATASTAVLIYFACTSGGLAYLLLAYGSRVLSTGKSRPGVQEWAHFIRLMARSDAAMFVIVNWAVAAASMFLLGTTMLFLGRLSSRESSLLLDRLVKYCLFKLMFVSALKMPPTLDETAEWIAWFAMAGFMRIFIGMARDRLELLAAAPAAPWTAHVRAVSLVLLILARDVWAIRDLWGTAPTSVAAALGISGVSQITAALGLRAAGGGGGGGGDTGGDVGGGGGVGSEQYGGGSVSRFVLCAYDLAVVMLEGVKTLLKYGVHCADSWAARRAAAQARAAAAATSSGAFNHHQPPQPPPAAASAPWESKGGLLYHVELTADVLTHMMTIMHYLHMWCLHGFTLHLVDMVLLLDVRTVMASLYRRIKTYCEYRTATYRLHHAFPDARPGEEEPCSICMEPMQVGKQLPCGHHFHLSCLRAWLQQSGAHTFTCPNCRQPLLVAPAAAPRRPNILDHARNHIQRQLTLLMLQLVRLLLEADQSVTQQQLRRQLRRRQEAAAARGRARGGRQVVAHEEPEGEGESSHPPPVSRLVKMMRRVWLWGVGGRRRASALRRRVAGVGRWFGLVPRRRVVERWQPGVAEAGDGRLPGGVDGADGVGQAGPSRERVGGTSQGAGLPQQGAGVAPHGEEEGERRYGQAAAGRLDAEGREEEEEEAGPWGAGTAPDDPQWDHQEGTSDEEEEEEVEQGEELWQGPQQASPRPAGGAAECPAAQPHLHGWPEHHHSLQGQPSASHGARPAPSAGPHQEEEDVVGGGAWEAGAGGAGGGGAAAGAGARRARRVMQRLSGPGPEMPLWSAGAVRQVAARVARSVRSSMAHGDSRAAVAGAGADHHEEVCSARDVRGQAQHAHHA